MSIRVYNENRLTKQPFFHRLINYLNTSDEISLRMIKKEFSDENNLDRKLEEYIKAGYILRKDKRYSINLPIFSDEDFDFSEESDEPAILIYEESFLVQADTQVDKALRQSQTNIILKNDTNDLKFAFSSDFLRTDDNLANYFFHVANNLQLSALEAEVYNILGDVDPNYALKYMTTFLLKYERRDLVPQKRADIFVKTLEKYGYIKKEDSKKYALDNLILVDNLDLEIYKFDTARDFISKQILQNKKSQARLSLT